MIIKSIYMQINVRRLGHGWRTERENVGIFIEIEIEEAIVLLFALIDKFVIDHSIVA